MGTDLSVSLEHSGCSYKLGIVVEPIEKIVGSDIEFANRTPSSRLSSMQSACDCIRRRDDFVGFRL